MDETKYLISVQSSVTLWLLTLLTPSILSQQGVMLRKISRPQTPLSTNLGMMSSTSPSFVKKLTYRSCEDETRRIKYGERGHWCHLSPQIYRYSTQLLTVRYNTPKPTCIIFSFSTYVEGQPFLARWCGIVRILRLSPHNMQKRGIWLLPLTLSSCS